MNGTLVDTSVLASALDAASEWHEWSTNAVLLAMARGPVAINPIIYAELSVPFERVEVLEHSIGADVERRPLPWSAGFLAGKAFLEYRRRGGERRSPLPDFYVGAHAAVERLDVLTRDPRRIRSYFPRVAVVSPG